MEKSRKDIVGFNNDSLYGSSLIKRAASLRLSSRGLSESLRSGSFKSLYKGRGVEFSGVREYLLGDDVRSIDWNVTARMGRPFVKQFEEDRELVLFLVVDASLSMTTGGGKKGRTRLYTACEVAALMALATGFSGGSLGGVIFDGSILYSHKPKSGKNQSLLFLNQLEAVLSGGAKGGGFQVTGGQLASATTGSSLDKALRGAETLLKKRALVMVISDFRTTGFQQDLAILSSRHDVVAIRISDPIDANLEGIGSLPFVDPESGYKQVLPTSSNAFQLSWQKSNQQREQQWQELCYRRGVHPLIISTQEDPVVSLQRFFSGREL